MLLELGKFISLLAGIVSLHAVFYTAFLAPVSGLRERIFQSLDMLTLAGGICLASGLIFKLWDRKAGNTTPSIAATLPMRIFWWFSGTVALLFAASWYIEECYLPLSSWIDR